MNFINDKAVLDHNIKNLEDFNKYIAKISEEG